MCYYVSEILDAGRNSPLFMVIPNNPSVKISYYSNLSSNILIVAKYNSHLSILKYPVRSSLHLVILIEILSK
jgi:hypothetical protein